MVQLTIALAARYFQGKSYYDCLERVGNSVFSTKNQ